MTQVRSTQLISLSHGLMCETGMLQQLLQKLYKREIHRSKEKKKYVVARSNRVDTRKDTRTVKHVDRRLKKDKRALKRAEKRKKGKR